MRDTSGIQFLASSRNWFLVLDSISNLYIMDAFSEKRFDLPPLESLKSDFFSLSRAGAKKFKERTNSSNVAYIQNTEDLRGCLWVGEKKEEYVVVWFFGMVVKYIAYCKNGEDHYCDIPTRMGVPMKLVGLTDILLHGGDSLYILTNDYFIRKLTFLGQVGFMDVSNYNTSLRNVTYNRIETRLSKNIAVTVSGEILLVEKCYKRKYFWSFRLYKKDPNPFYHNSSVEVYSLGNEALLLDLGIIVPADHTLGIEPNSIYFTLHDRVHNCGWKRVCLDIGVFNLATKELKRFSGLGLSDLRFKDARWFLPS